MTGQKEKNLKHIQEYMYK